MKLLFAILSVALSVWPGGPAYAESDSAFTDFETISEAAFPPIRLQKNHRRPTPREKEALELARTAALGLIEASGPIWFRHVADPLAPSAPRLRETLATLKQVPLWICSYEGCSGCPGDENPRGCARGKKIADVVGIVLSIHPCLLRSGAQCPSRGRVSSQELIDHFTRTLTQAAHYKIHGSTDSPVRNRAVKGAVGALAGASSIARAVVGACPGPFPARGAAFLRQAGHLRDIGPFAEQCGERLLQPLKREPLPGPCSLVIDPARFRKILAQGMLKTLPAVVRCDSFCEALTCGEMHPAVPRPLPFGESWMLSIPEGACDGASPSDPQQFLERVLRMVARREVLAQGEASAAIPLCARALLPEGAARSRSSTGTEGASQPEGPDVQLID